MISRDPRLNRLLMSMLFGAFVPTEIVDEPQEITKPQFCLGVDTGDTMSDCFRMGLAGNCGTDTTCDKCKYNEEDK